MKGYVILLHTIDRDGFISSYVTHVQRPEVKTGVT
jgi:hypothetical protein